MEDDYTTNSHYLTYTFPLKDQDNVLVELVGKGLIKQDWGETKWGNEVRFVWFMGNELDILPSCRVGPSVFMLQYLPRTLQNRGSCPQESFPAYNISGDINLSIHKATLFLFTK